MYPDRFHNCPKCELTLPASSHQYDSSCPRCLVEDGKGVAMGLVSPCSAAVAVVAAPR